MVHLVEFNVLYLIFVTSLKEQRTEDGEKVTEIVGLANFEGLQLRQFTAGNIAFVIKLALMFRSFIAKYLGECYAVNGEKKFSVHCT